MKRFILLLLVILIGCMPIKACAQEDHQAVINGIYDYLCGDISMQAWIDQSIAERAGSSADYYIINLNRAGYDLESANYVQAALQKILNGEISNPVSRMRCALAVLSCVGAEGLPEGFADECIGKLGVMSYCFGLHLINNGLSSSQWTQEALVSKLISLQKADGGWAVTGNFGDVDVTAMCLQALAVCDESEAISQAVDAALAFISGRQLDSAGFISLGHENCESAAQVLVALTSLGIDPAADERFIKNGKTVLDAMMAYRMPSGGFSHLPGEAENETACVQVLQALHALEMTGSPFYRFENTVKATENDMPADLPAWKLWAFGAIALFVLAGSIYALTRKYGKGKQMLFVLIIAGVAATAVWMINIETASDYYQADEIADASGIAYLQIRCDTVAGRRDDGSTPADGVILERTAMPFAEGDSVFDILTDAARRYEIQLEHDGGIGDMAYVTGINYLYEYTFGDLSGWVFSVNGSRISQSCGAYELKDGDEIAWNYTLELGEDIK